MPVSIVAGNQQRRTHTRQGGVVGSRVRWSLTGACQITEFGGGCAGLVFDRGRNWACMFLASPSAVGHVGDHTINDILCERMVLDSVGRCSCACNESVVEGGDGNR